VAYLGKLKDDQTALNKNIAELVIYSEGAVSWTEAWFIPPMDRDLLIKTLNKYNQMKSGTAGNNELL
jgi:hypothetical protein